VEALRPGGPEAWRPWRPGGLDALDALEAWMPEGLGGPETLEATLAKGRKLSLGLQPPVCWTPHIFSIESHPYEPTEADRIQ
jgi:hypothetical protein